MNPVSSIFNENAACLSSFIRKSFLRFALSANGYLFSPLSPNHTDWGSFPILDTSGGELVFYV